MGLLRSMYIKHLHAFRGSELKENIGEFSIWRPLSFKLGGGAPPPPSLAPSPLKLGGGCTTPPQPC